MAKHITEIQPETL